MSSVIATACRFSSKRGRISTKRRMNVSPDTSRKNSTTSVVNRPAARLVVPLNNAPMTLIEWSGEACGTPTPTPVTLCNCAIIH